MKILVCMSVVPDTTTKITFVENNTKFNTQGVQFIINPYDEVSITKSLELTEKLGGTVSLVHVGLTENDAVIRKGLAIGAHDAFRINAEATDGQFVAEQIAAFAKDKGYDIIFTGRESIDYNGGQVCGLVAELLGLPSVNIITSIEVDGNTATMTRDIDGGSEKLSCSLPMVVSAQKDLCEPRIPNMRGIMSARTKPLTVIEPISVESFGKFQSFESPKPKASVKLIDPEHPEELIQLLRNEAKVI
ncbi:MAG: electron transfer flavoprotein subunit beta/FixA family protein [Bacteroidia bacterium]|nr:electron transfer flavoprotein subunit beta/FixA family protein [Bacteroidia bacterium]MCO5252747.1 electron transfer flavoprotein subunit beta/FixA family protein [Bacteroidota bacterium]